jgi:pyruvate/2-oxoglutarate dehydrogenase complex dihydrolipoamide acyltransferase (E2) component
LLILTTKRRVALSVLLFLVWAPVANAWTWPVQGPVLQPFSYDEAHPYAAGQHRGIDVGASGAGEQVVASAAGTVSFAGSVPSSGESVTIETADGYSVTLTHLGSIAVAKGASVAEGDAVGTIGPSGTPEVDGPYLHLGIRVTSDPNGYLDPLRFLPQPSASSPAQSGQPASQPSASGGAVAVPTTSAQPEPATSTSTPTATPQAANARTTRLSSRSRPGRGRAERPRSSGTEVREVLRSRSPRRLTPSATPVRRRLATPQRRIDVAPRSARRPVVEASPTARLRLDAGHELPASLERPHPEHSSVLLPLSCNGAAALVALAAAFAAGRSGRRRVGDGPVAQVHRLPRSVAGRGHERRAA